MRIGRIHPVAAAEVRQLPTCCAQCCGEIGPDATATPSWALAADQRFGLSGVVARDDDAVIGWLLVAPAFNLPRHHPLSQAPRTADVAIVVGACVLPGYRDAGVARQLVQTLAARLTGSVEAIEALASTGSEHVHTPAAAWLEEVGFQVVPGGTSSPNLVRMRLDLASTVRWLPDLKSAWDALTGWLPRPGVSPEPSGRGVGRGVEAASGQLVSTHERDPHRSASPSTC